MGCYCMNPKGYQDCVKYGCAATRVHDSAWPTYQSIPVGCICPAGANKDCERFDCPRKSPTPEAK